MVKTRLNLKRLVATVIGAGILTVSFQNCGQPGQLAVVDPQALQDAQGGSPLDPGAPPDNVVPGVFKDYVKDVNILAKTEKLDVLVVIDNSGSMGFEQKNMADRMDTMVQQLANLSWRLAVTTTEVNSNAMDGLQNSITGRTDGQLLLMAQNKTFVSSDDNMLLAQDLFSRTVQRSEEGSGAEQGVRATYRFLERSLMAGSANANFLRPDAALSVVVVTDANETPFNRLTDHNQPLKLLEYVSKTFPMKPFLFHSIIVKKDDVPCLNLAGARNEGYGLFYQDLSNRTGGVVGSVCEMDYSSQLKLIGEASAQLVKNVTLDCAPADSDKDGILDLKITSLTAGNVLPAYKVVGAQVQFATDLMVGQYKFEYKCAQVAMAAK